MSCYAIRIISARDLVAADDNGFSDPYCKVASKSQNFKTRIVKKSLTPEWNETFEISVSDKLHLSVFDHDVLGKDDPLGDVDIALSELQAECKEMNKEILKTYKLQNTSKGEITVGMTQIPQITKKPGLFRALSSGEELKKDSPSEKRHHSHIAKAGAIGLATVRVRCIRGIDLVANDSGGTSDPYIKIKGPHSKTLKTKIIKKTVNPEWNESFLVEFQEYFDVQVFDENMINDVSLGSVHISEEDMDEVFKDLNKEFVRVLPLQGVPHGKLELGFTGVGAPKKNLTGLLLNQLGGRRRVILEKGPLGLLLGLMFFSFLLGYFNLKILMLIALAGYIGAYVQLGRNPQAEKEDKEKERELWASHYKMYPQVETCEWLNQSMTQFWIKNGPAIGEMIIQNTNPVLEQNKPAFLKSITLDKVNFGQHPPKLDSIRVDTSDPNSWVLDYYVSFYSDMYYEMSVKSGVISAPMVVENIVFFAKMRVVIEYMDPIPFIARVSTSVMEKPKIDFQVRPLKGLDLTAFPGLSPWLNHLINDLVIDGMLLYPNKFVVELSHLALKKADDLTEGKTNTTATTASAPPTQQPKTTPAN